MSFYCALYTYLFQFPFKKFFTATIAQRPAGVFVDPAFDLLDLFVRLVVKIHPFWNMPPDHLVLIFIASPLIAAIRVAIIYCSPLSLAAT